MALVMRDFPVMRYDCDFFERIKKQMNMEFKQIEEEIDRMRRQMHHLVPMDLGDVMLQEIRPSVPIVEEKGETKLKLEFSVKEFRPEDLEVKLLGNNILQVLKISRAKLICTVLYIIVRNSYCLSLYKVMSEHHDSGVLRPILD